MPQPLGMIQPVGGSASLGTNIAAVKVAAGISFYRYDLVVFYTHQQGAAAMVHPAAVRFVPGDVVRHLIPFLRSASPKSQVSDFS